MNEYYHTFRYTNHNRVRFEIGVEVILARSGDLKYRAYDTKRDPEEANQVVDLTDCPLTRNKKPSIKGIEKQIKKELLTWVPFGVQEERRSSILR